jgi:hypothetical protein
MTANPPGAEKPDPKKKPTPPKLPTTPSTPPAEPLGQHQTHTEPVKTD